MGVRTRGLDMKAGFERDAEGGAEATAGASGGEQAESDNAVNLRHRARQSLASLAPRRAHAMGLGGRAPSKPPSSVTRGQVAKAVRSEDRLRPNSVGTRRNVVRRSNWLSSQGTAVVFVIDGGVLVS
jgi:hypothetical protein